MEPESIFQLVNVVALFAWILLVAFPDAKVTLALVSSGIILLFLSGLYALFVLVFLNFDFMKDIGTLAGVMHAFTDPMGVVLGWTHFLAFDLFMGMWITNDAMKSGINRWILLACQIATFALGPIGFLAYYVARLLTTKVIQPRLISD